MKTSKKLYDIDDTYRIYAVIRNPEDRLISAWQTIAPSTPWFIFLLRFNRTINQLSIDEINNHLRPQTWFYNYRKIDEFVKIEGLSYWLNLLNINDIKSNQSNHLHYKIPKWAKEFYKKITKWLKR